jgi:hypothetical protein
LRGSSIEIPTRKAALAKSAADRALLGLQEALGKLNRPPEEVAPSAPARLLLGNRLLGHARASISYPR